MRCKIRCSRFVLFVLLSSLPAGCSESPGASVIDAMETKDALSSVESALMGMVSVNDESVPVGFVYVYEDFDSDDQGPRFPVASGKIGSNGRYHILHVPTGAVRIVVTMDRGVRSQAKITELSVSPEDPSWNVQKLDLPPEGAPNAATKLIKTVQSTRPERRIKTANAISAPGSGPAFLDKNLRKMLSELHHKYGCLYVKDPLRTTIAAGKNKFDLKLTIP